MKLTKLLILALGLMALTASTTFADAAFFSFASKRNVATNAQTGEVDSVILVSSYGTLMDPGYIPESRSIFYTFSQPISHLGDIDVVMQLAFGDAYMPDPITQYGVWYPIYRSWPGPDPQIAEIRVGYNGADPPYHVVQIHFLEDTYVYEGNTIKLSGVRVNMDSLGQVEGSTVTVSLSNPEGDIAIDNAEDLTVAVLHHPIECENCEPTVTFRSDGRAIYDIATLTISELFTNAFEEPTQIRISIGTLPTGFVFDGIEGNEGSASASWSCVGQTCTFTITDQDESYLEDLQIGLIFDLVGIPPGGTIPDVPVTIYLYPAGSGSYPWIKLKYAYMPITCYLSFEVVEKEGGTLLSVFNTWYEGIWDTGIAIMNGSGAEPLDEYREWWGHWWDIPQYGTVTVYMYPQDTALTNNPALPTTPYVFTTGPTMMPGLGIDEFGRIPPMGEWTVLVSELLQYAVNAQSQLHSGPFTGFIIFECNFPLAEGDNYVTDWVTQSQGYAMINLTLREEQERRGRRR